MSYDDCGYEYCDFCKKKFYNSLTRLIYHEADYKVCSHCKDFLQLFDCPEKVLIFIKSVKRIVRSGLND